ncbi:hypothetical protein [Fischerella sp. NIES-3754]|nr:hypothetical protein [Fischerella sp. NIES-3754]
MLWHASIKLLRSQIYVYQPQELDLAIALVCIFAASAPIYLH